jgi:hypothetical protein
MPAVLLEDESEVLPDELRTTDAAFAGSRGEQPIVRWVERHSGRIFSLKVPRTYLTGQIEPSSQGLAPQQPC